MKTLFTILLGFFIMFNVNAQIVKRDTLFFPDYERDVKDILSYKPDMSKKNITLWKTGSVVVGTFLVNEAIIRHDKNVGNKNTKQKTTIIYLAGVTASMITFSIEIKNH